MDEHLKSLVPCGTLKVVQSTRALLRARCRLFSLAEKGLTPGSDYSEKQNQVLILKEQLTRKAG